MNRFLIGLCVALFAFPSVAGGDYERVIVTSFTSLSETDYIVVVEPQPDGTYRDPYMGSCKIFEVRGTYARLKGAPLFSEHQVKKSSHLAAIALLQKAFAEKTPIDLGWMGSAFERLDSNDPCIVRSRALDFNQGSSPAVVSYFYKV